MVVYVLKADQFSKRDPQFVDTVEILDTSRSPLDPKVYTPSLMDIGRPNPRN